MVRCANRTIWIAVTVNTERAKLGWDPVELRVIDVISPTKPSINGQDISALKISSTWIRQYISTHQHEENHI
jgi:phosphopantetheine adenylyltransferase